MAERKQRAMGRLEMLRHDFLHFSQVYADYIVLREQLLRVKMERELRRRLALEMGKVLEQHKITVRHLMELLERPASRKPRGRGRKQ